MSDSEAWQLGELGLSPEPQVTGQNPFILNLTLQPDATQLEGCDEMGTHLSREWAVSWEVQPGAACTHGLGSQSRPIPMPPWYLHSYLSTALVAGWSLGWRRTGENLTTCTSQRALHQAQGQGNKELSYRSALAAPAESDRGHRDSGGPW